MGERDHALHLDPTLRPPVVPGLGGQSSLPPVPDYQLTPPSLHMPPRAHPTLGDGRGLVPPGMQQGGQRPNLSLDPAHMLPLFSHYSDPDQDLGRRILAPVPPAPGHRGGAVAPPGLTVGDWRISGAPVFSTSDRYDSPQTRERAERQEYDEREAQRRGETAPNPVGDLLRR